MVALALSFLPAAAPAQTVSNAFTGFATVSVGAAHHGDLGETSFMPGASVAVTDPNGFGAELDLAHTGGFDSERFSESSITTFTVNATWTWPRVDALVRPYLVGGAGVLRVRACGATCDSRTDWAADAGGGAFVLLNELVGVRGDIRYFRYLDDHSDLVTGDGFFDFWRTSVGVVFSWPVR